MDLERILTLSKKIVEGRKAEEELNDYLNGAEPKETAKPKTPKPATKPKNKKEGLLPLKLSNGKALEYVPSEEAIQELFPLLYSDKMTAHKIADRTGLSYQQAMGILYKLHKKGVLQRKIEKMQDKAGRKVDTYIWATASWVPKTPLPERSGTCLLTPNEI